MTTHVPPESSGTPASEPLDADPPPSADRRLERLERRLAEARRRQRWTVAGLAVLAAAAALVGWSGPGPAAADAQEARVSLPPGAVDSVRARSYSLVDSAGRVRGVWTVRDGEPSLELHDGNHVPRVYLSLPESGPRAALVDRRGGLRAFIGLAGGEPAVVLFDGEGRHRVELSMAGAGPALKLFDGEGTARLQGTLPPSGAELELRDGAGEVTWSAGR